MIKKIIKSKIIYPALTLTFGMLSGAFTSANDYIWYYNLIQPKFNPPNWIFAPIWTILYLLIGISFYKIWNHKKLKLYRIAFYIFLLHFIGNLAWSYIFFKQHNLLFALWDLSFLWLSLLIVIIMSHKIKHILKLLLPYLLWLSYALYLNFSIWQLN